MARWSKIPKTYPLLFGTVLAFAVSQVITTFHIIREPHPFDWLVHFTFLIAISQLLYVVLENYELHAKKNEKISSMTTPRIILMVLLVGMGIGVWWEIIEFSSDHLLGTHLQLNNADTMGDLIADTLGSLVGGIILVFLSKYREKR